MLQAGKQTMSYPATWSGGSHISPPDLWCFSETLVSTKEPALGSVVHDPGFLWMPPSFCGWRDESTGWELSGQGSIKFSGRPRAWV